MRPSTINLSRAILATSLRIGSKLERSTASGVSSITRSTPVNVSIVRIFLPSRPIILPFISSFGNCTTEIVDSAIEVAMLSGLIAGEIGVDVRNAKRAGLLHDIGKSIDQEMEGTHVQIGVDLCRKYKESPLVINAVECTPTSSTAASPSCRIISSTSLCAFSTISSMRAGWMRPSTINLSRVIACIVQAADTISAARPGARRETLETYTNRLNQLEDIANGFKGVDKSFAISAGREIRVMVVPEQVSDDDMVLMARELSKKIEDELQYPGQIKVNVIRESRVTDYAK